MLLQSADSEDSNATFASQISQFGGFVTFRNPKDIWINHPTFLIQELVVFAVVFLNFLHARKNGGRFMHYWWATVIVSIATEMVCYNIPELDNFWHAQSSVMFASGRFPLYIVLLYNAFYYPAAIAVSKAKLAWWAEPIAVGLCSVLMDVPYDIMGVKLLHWTWHDTDNVLADRSYWVPWTSYYFHTAFSTALFSIFFGLRRLLMPGTPVTLESSGNVILEVFCTVVAGLLGAPIGSLLFLIYYHPLHDHYDVHSEVPVLMFLVTCVVIVWTADRHRAMQSRDARRTGRSYETGVFGGVMLHYLSEIMFVLIAKPESILRTGLSQVTGPCNVTEESVSLSGKVLTRRKYLCVSNYDEGYFDWHCRSSGMPPADGLTWYTMCGTPFPNHTEYIAIVCFFSVLGCYVYYQLFYGSKELHVAPQAQKTERKMKKK